MACKHLTSCSNALSPDPQRRHQVDLPRMYTLRHVVTVGPEYPEVFRLPLVSPSGSWQRLWWRPLSFLVSLLSSVPRDPKHHGLPEDLHLDVDSSPASYPIPNLSAAKMPLVSSSFLFPRLAVRAPTANTRSYGVGLITFWFPTLDLRKKAFKHTSRARLIH